jgi:hypothetical protein
MTIRLIVVAFAATASLAVAACGGSGDPSASGTGTTKGPNAATKKALLQFAQCMRDHGIDMPDPNFSGGRVTMQSSARNISPEKQKAAEQACQKYQAKIKPPATSAAEKEQFKKKALANAQCMRDHGITNFPDPQFDANGGAQISIGKGNGIDPNSAKFQAAQKACEKIAGVGGGPSTQRVGDGK